MPHKTPATLSPHLLLATVLASLREHWRPLLAYHLFFTLLSATLVLPITANALAALLKRIGKPVLTNSQLLDILLSPWGMLWVLAAIGLTFLVLFLQQAGMILLTIRPGAHRYRAALEALWAVMRRLPALALLTLIQVGSHLLLALPFLLLLVGLHQLILGDMENYYVMQVHPKELWFFCAAGLPVTLSWFWLAARLYLRWALSLPALIIEERMPLDALSRSHQLTLGYKRSLVLPVSLPVVAIIMLPVLITALFDSLVTPLLLWLPERMFILIPAMLAYLTAYSLLALAATFVGVAVNSLLTGCLYLRLAHRQPKLPTPPSGSSPAWVAWGAEALVLAFAIGQATLVLTSFEIHDRVAITAHRGSSFRAPENTLAAIEQAIADGADYVEIDVRLTKDNRVVLSHDDNLLRLTGLNQRLSEMTLEEVRKIDIGSWFGDAYIGEHIPSLDEVLAVTRGRINLYIELKPAAGDTESLVAAVIDRLPEARHDEVFMASMSPAVVREIKRQAPYLRTVLFAQFVVRGGLDMSILDALGLRFNRVTDDAVDMAQRHGHQLHTWTVNSPSEMSRMIDLGVDNIITDRPDLLSGVLAERAELSDGALLLVKLRNWLHS